MPRYRDRFPIESIINDTILYEIRDEDKNKACVYLLAIYYNNEWLFKYGWCSDFEERVKSLNTSFKLNCQEPYNRKYDIANIIPLIILWTDSIHTTKEFERLKFPKYIKDNNFQLVVNHPNKENSKLNEFTKVNYNIYDKFLEYAEEYDEYNTWSSDIYFLDDYNKLSYKNYIISDYNSDYNSDSDTNIIIKKTKYT
jgi:hypothetical protein